MEKQIFKQHWSKWVFIYTASWFGYHAGTELSMTVCSVIRHQESQNTTSHAFCTRISSEAPRAMWLHQGCRRSALQDMFHTLSSQNIQPSSFHIAIHFLSMHLGFFPARECQSREGGMVHTWILFRPATSTQLDPEGTPRLYNFKGIWNPQCHVVLRRRKSARAM